MGDLSPTSRAPRRRDRPALRTLVAIAIALASHGALLAAVARAGPILAPRRSRLVTLAPLSAAQWSANREIRGAPPPPLSAPPLSSAPAPAPTPPPPSAQRVRPEPTGQVVDVAPSRDSTPPESARFLSDRNNRVEKETRSRFAGKFEATAATPVNGPRGEQGAPRSGDMGQAEESRPENTEPRGSDAVDVARKEPPRLSDARPLLRHGERGEAVPPDALRPSPDAALFETPRARGEGEDGQRRAGAFDPRLLPTAETYRQLSGGPAPDALDGIAEGDGTLLNTHEWKYASFLNRVKRAVVGPWNPEAPLQAHDPGLRRYGHGTWFTQLAVTLDDKGGLKAVAVARSCGLDFLDEAAVDAFRKAQPFPNPPLGLVDGRGEIRFRFGFLVEPTRFGLERLHVRGLGSGDAGSADGS